MICSVDQSTNGVRLTATGSRRIGSLVGSISRLAGGPFVSVRRLSQSIGQLPGFSVSVFGLRDRHTDDDAGLWTPLAPRTFPIAGPRAFGYSPSLKGALLDDGLDLVHVHGLWMYPSLASANWHRRTDRPHLVSPRGMLDPWAIRHSAWKKRIAATLYENRNLRNAACLHALCQAEADAIRAGGYTNPICVIPNGIDLPNGPSPTAPPWQGRVAEGQKVLLFLGRIHPKKGLPHLLQAWAMIREMRPRASREWTLVVAGMDQLGHEGELRRKFPDESVVWVGPQFGAQKASCLTHADAFVLPSHSEGLPMAVLEAWAYKLPTLITPACNLPEGFAAEAALRIGVNAEETAAGLEQLIAMSPEARVAMGARARTLAAERFSWSRIATEMAEVYQWALGEGPVPSTVQFA